SAFFSSKNCSPQRSSVPRQTYSLRRSTTTCWFCNSSSIWAPRGSCGDGSEYTMIVRRDLNQGAGGRGQGAGVSDNRFCYSLPLTPDSCLYGLPGTAPGMTTLPEHLVTGPAALAECCAHLAACDVLGFDTEFVGESTYRPHLCLIQVATPQRLYLIDPLADPDRGPDWLR